MNLRELADRYSIPCLQSRESLDDSKHNAFFADMKDIQDKQALLEELYRVVGAQRYLPHANLDGLEEILAPDIWPGKKELSLSLLHATQLEQLDEKLVEVLLQIMQSCRESWSEQGKIFMFSLILED